MLMLVIPLMIVGVVAAPLQVVLTAPQQAPKLPLCITFCCLLCGSFFAAILIKEKAVIRVANLVITITTVVASFVLVGYLLWRVRRHNSLFPTLAKFSFTVLTVFLACWALELGASFTNIHWLKVLPMYMAVVVCSYLNLCMLLSATQSQNQKLTVPHSLYWSKCHKSNTRARGQTKSIATMSAPSRYTQAAPTPSSTSTAVWQS